jgi:sugar/nucleoside kinase (ribokinase family)
MQHDVVVAGHICLDLTPRFPDIGAASLSQVIVPGAITLIGECVVSTGGPVANTGVALVKLGVGCRLMGNVGDDAFGRLVVEKLEEFGCAEGVARVPGEQTAYTIVVAPPGIDRAFLHNPGANDSFCADDIDYSVVSRARLFHLGYPPLLKRLYENDGDQLVRVFRQAKECGATTSVDMALPDPDSPAGRADWHSILQALLPHVDLFLPSAEEVVYFMDRRRFMELRGEAAAHATSVLDMLSPDDYSTLSEQLIGYGAGAVALKSGHRGVYLRTAPAGRLAGFGRAAPRDTANWADRELWQPAYRVLNVASATGSGDCAIAGFLAAFGRGESVEGTLKYATAVGAQNVMAHDAVSGVQSYEQTTRMLGVAPQADLDLSRCGGWRRDEGQQMWERDAG